uniref:F-box domain-containing protein n=1 Tax=Globodera pallida TaxID=36090 RepID=A0A183BRQ0_GLOPA
MSDNPQQRRNGELKVCDDDWLGMFPFLGPAELAFVMALLSDRFDALVDLHFRTSKWTLGNLELHRSEDGARIVKNNGGGSIERLPIPQGPPPAKLIGFKYMEIFYINDTVIAFLRHILFDVGITLQLNIFEGENRSWDILVQQIWPLLSSNINEMDLFDETIHELRSRISPTVLCDCANLRSIYSCGLLTPEFPADDRREDSDGQAMTKWIHTPREDGLPKTFLYYGPMLLDTVVNGFRETFLNASTAVNYIIVLDDGYAPAGDEEAPADYVPFDLKNEQTWERLAFRRQDDHKWLMERGPILRDEKQWTEWKKEELEGSQQENWIVVFVDEN